MLNKYEVKRKRKAEGGDFGLCQELRGSGDSLQTERETEGRTDGKKTQTDSERLGARRLLKLREKCLK